MRQPVNPDSNSMSVRRGSEKRPALDVKKLADLEAPVLVNRLPYQSDSYLTKRGGDSSVSIDSYFGPGPASAPRFDSSRGELLRPVERLDASGAPLLTQRGAFLAQPAARGPLSLAPLLHMAAGGDLSQAVDLDGTDPVSPPGVVLISSGELFIPGMERRPIYPIEASDSCVCTPREATPAPGPVAASPSQPRSADAINRGADGGKLVVQASGPGVVGIRLADGTTKSLPVRREGGHWIATYLPTNSEHVTILNIDGSAFDTVFVSGNRNPFMTGAQHEAWVASLPPAIETARGSREWMTANLPIRPPGARGWYSEAELAAMTPEELRAVLLDLDGRLSYSQGEVAAGRGDAGVVVWLLGAIKEVQGYTRPAISLAQFTSTLPPGVRVWTGKELDSGDLSGLGVADAHATMAWYHLYGTTPTHLGGATPGERPQIDAWRHAAMMRNLELATQGATSSESWGAFVGFVDSLSTNWITGVNPITAPLYWVRWLYDLPTTIQGMQDRAAWRTEWLAKAGYDPHLAGFFAFVLALGDLLPSNKFAEGATGISSETGESLSGWEMAYRLGLALVETVLLAIGAEKGGKGIGKGGSGTGRTPPPDGVPSKPAHLPAWGTADLTAAADPRGALWHPEPVKFQFDPHSGKFSLEILPRDPMSPEVGWKPEGIGTHAKAYDFQMKAPGARPGEAPYLVAFDDVSKTAKHVKFDGIDGRTLIDRKWGIRISPKSRAQVRSQATALRQNGMKARWEVPTEYLKRQFDILLREEGATDVIYVEVKK